MAQIIEVVIAMVVSAMMASAITTLALSPIKTQRQKNVYAASEGAAIAVRKCILNKPSVFRSDVLITANNVSKYCLEDNILPPQTDVSCEVLNNYKPVGTLVNVPYAIECKQAGITGNMAGTAWQPLYTVNALAKQASSLKTSDIKICLSKWLSDPSATYPSQPSTESFDKYVAECDGITSLNFEAKDWKAATDTPCAITIETKTEPSPPTTKTIVAFSSGNETCDPPNIP